MEIAAPRQVGARNDKWRAHIVMTNRGVGFITPRAHTIDRENAVLSRSPLLVLSNQYSIDKKIWAMLALSAVCEGKGEAGQRK